MRYTTIKVGYKNQILNLYIVKEDLDRILCRKWFYKLNLDWHTFNKVRTTSQRNLSELLNEYKEIFDDKLGEINKTTAKT